MLLNSCPQLGELVATGDGHRVCEVAAREAAGGVEEGADLAGERPTDTGCGEHREEEEGDQQAADDEAVLGNGVRQSARVLEEGELDRRAGGLGDALDPGAVVGTLDLDVMGLALAAEPGAVADPVSGGGEEAVVAVDGGVEPGQGLDARGKGVCGGDRDDEHAERLAPCLDGSTARGDATRWTGLGDEALVLLRVELDEDDAEGAAEELVETGLDSGARGEGRTEGPIGSDFAKGGLGAGGRLLVDAEGGASACGDAGIHLAGLAARREREQHESERDHRHDHQQHEEQPQAAPEAHSGPEYRRASGPRSARAPLPWSSHGAIAQLGERLDRTQEVAGSSPASSMLTESTGAPWPRRREPLKRRATAKATASLGA
jgi:hypothetical protein